MNRSAISLILSYRFECNGAPKAAVDSAMSMLLIATMIFLIPSAFGDESAPVFDARATLKQAQENYDQGIALRDSNSVEARRRFDAALQSYEKLLNKNNQNASLLFNAGNAAYHLGNHPKAIVYYRRALLLEPGAQDIRQNLNQTRNQVNMQIPARNNYALWLRLQSHESWLTPTQWKYLAYFGYALFWTLVAIRFTSRKNKHRTPFWAIGVCLLVAVVAGRVVWAVAARQENPQAGVIARDQTELLKGNGNGYQRQIAEPLSQGVEFELIESRPDPEKTIWHRIRLPDGTDGWIQADRALLI